MGGIMPGHDVRDFGVLRTEGWWSKKMRLPDEVPASGNCAHPVLYKATTTDHRGYLLYLCPDCSHSVELKVRRLRPNPPCAHPVLVADGMVCSYSRYTCPDCRQSVNLHINDTMYAPVSNPHITQRRKGGAGSHGV